METPSVFLGVNVHSFGSVFSKSNKVRVYTKVIEYRRCRSQTWVQTLFILTVPLPFLLVFKKRYSVNKYVGPKEF